MSRSRKYVPIVSTRSWAQEFWVAASCPVTYTKVEPGAHCLCPTLASPGAIVFRAAAGAIRFPGRSTPFIETIRFAAANRVLVELDYVDKEGKRSTRAIEAYSR